MKTHAHFVRVRPAEPGDCADIFAMICELADYEKLRHEVVGTAASLREALFGPRVYLEALVGEADGRPAGYAAFYPTYSTFGGSPGIFLEDLYVRPAARRMGLGMEMLRAVARIAVERGCGRMEWIALDWNEPALAFYRTIGASPKADWVLHRWSGDELRRAAGA